MSDSLISVILKVNKYHKIPKEFVDVVHIVGQLYEANVSRNIFNKVKIDPAIATITQTKRASQKSNNKEYF